LILTKIIKIVANTWRILWIKCTKFDFGCGSDIDPPLSEFTAPPDPLAVLGGLLLRKRREGGDGREGKGGRRAFPLSLFYETTTDP